VVTSGGSTLSANARQRFFDMDLLPTSLKSESLDGESWAIACAFIAYAAGDAFGAAHEFVANPPEKIHSIILGKPDWPYGGVSDDTTLSLLTIQSLAEDNAEAAAAKYLELLRASQESLRGLGPTTRFALGMSVKEEEQHFIGVSNGGMMRTALLGIAFDSSHPNLREEWVKASVQSTHKNPLAVSAALSLSSLFSEAVTLGSKVIFPTLPNDWSPPSTGISLDPIESYRAVIHVASQATSVEDAFIRACELGGDTDTVAALSGSLVAAQMRNYSGLFEIPWLMDVKWSEIPQMKNAIELLISRRNQWGK
jgi:ADP-ribosylglycohydrolase